MVYRSHHPGLKIGLEDAMKQAFKKRGDIGKHDVDKKHGSPDRVFITGIFEKDAMEYVERFVVNTFEELRNPLCRNSVSPGRVGGENEAGIVYLRLWSAPKKDREKALSCILTKEQVERVVFKK